MSKKGFFHHKYGLDIYGYGTGIAIALATVAAFTSVGFYAGRVTAPEPCIANLHSHTYPVFGWEQEMLEENWQYEGDHIWKETGITNSVELAHYLVASYNEYSEEKGDKYRVSIYQNPRTGEEFYIPGLCSYVVDGLGDPVLYRKY